MVRNADSKSLLPMLQDLGIRAVSDVLNALVSLATVSLIARQLLTADYGAFTQLVITVSVLVPVILLRLNTACVRFFPGLDNNPRARREQFSRVLLLVLLLAGIVAASLTATAEAVSVLIFAESRPARLVGFLAAYLLLRCLVTLLIDYFRARSRIGLASALNSGRLVLLLAAIAWIVMNEGGLEQVLLAHLLAESLVLLVLLVMLWRGSALAVPPTLRRLDLAPYLQYSLPLVPYSLLLAVNQFADRYFITHMVGLDEAGVYSFSYNLIAAAFLFTASISYVVFPHVARRWEAGDKAQVQALLFAGQRVFVALAIPATVGLLLIYRPLVEVLVGDDYQLASVAAGGILLGQVFLGLCSVFGFAIDLSKKTGLYLKILALTAAVNTVLNFLLVPIYGVSGAALATALTYLLQLLLMVYATPGLIGIPIRIDLRFALLCAIPALLMWLVLGALPAPSGALQILGTVLLGAAIYGCVALLLLRGKLRHIMALLGRP